MTAAPRDERLLRAIQYAASALDTDQPLRLTLHASDQSKIIRCNRSSLYRFGVGCLVVFAAALAPFTVESGLGDLTADESRRATTDRTNGVMVGVVALLACDYAGELRMRVGGSRDVVSTRLLLRLIALTVLFANAFARTALLTFAPVVLIWTEFPPLRNVVGAWRSHGATFLGVIAVFVSVLLLFAQLGVLLWADCYDSRMYADDDGADDGGELGVEFCVEFDGAFATLARSALTLFVLSTTENAPFVMWPAVDCGRGRRKSHRSVFGGDVDRRAVVFAAIAYFTAYIVVMVYVVVNFMLGSVYDAWHEGHVARVEDEKVRRFHALDAAFHAISRGRTDEDLDRDGWFAFYSELCPGRSRTAADVAFEVLDPDRRGGQRVSHAQFVLRGYRALRADVVLVAARRERRELKTVATTRAPLARIDSAPLDDDASDAASNAPSLDSDARRDVWRRKWRVAITAIVAAVRMRDADLGAVRRLCRSVSASRPFSYVAHVLCVAYVAVEFAHDLDGSGQRAAPGHRELQDTTDGVLDVLAICFALQALVRACGGGARRVEVAFDDGLVAVAFAGRVVLDPALAGVLEKNEWHVCSTSLKRIAGMAVAARLLALSASARSVLVGVSKLKRQIALFAMVFASVVYVYAAVGVALCGDVLPGRERWVYDGDDGSYDDDVDDVLLRHRDRHVMDNRFAFSSFQKAWMTLIEIFLTNNWQDIVNAYLTSGVARRTASPARRSVIALYLVSFYVVSVMFLTNVVVALITHRDAAAAVARVAGLSRRAADALLDLVDKTYESLEARLAAAAGGGDTPSHLRSRSLRPRGSMTRGSSTSSAAAPRGLGRARVLAVARFRALGRVRSRSRDPHAPPPPPPPMPWRASSTASARRRSTRPSTTR
ncbi:hypothetical protein SO694_00086048 [Aureococcus anophagefferens]|uniref:Ion transport domain-containing protein n=1 Tax=Aureococcus anophagefferens TaxID=44056 RepID=A0ABR1G4L9_AURAN